MPTLISGQTATVSVTVPGSYVTVACDPGEVIRVDWTAPGAVKGSQTVTGITTDVGPFADFTEVTLTAVTGSPDYTVATGLTAAQITAITASVVNASGARTGYQSVTPNLTKWRAAKARGSSAPARHLWLGDSNVAGAAAGTGAVGSVGAYATGMVTLFSARFAERCDNVFGDQNITSTVTPTQYDPRVTQGTGWATSATPGTVGGRFYEGTAGAAGALTIALDQSCDRIDFWYPQTSTANTALVVRIDGNIVETINQTGTNAYVKKTYSVSPGLHTITFNVGATGTGFVAAVIPYTSTSAQPIALRGGWSGALAANLATVTNPWSALNVAAALTPDFVTLYCTINDVTVPTAVATYRTSMESIVSTLSATATGCLVMGFPNSSTNMTSGLADQYAMQLQALAVDYGWGYYDSRAVFGSSNTAAIARGVRFDTLHPNLAGHTAFVAGYGDYLAACGY